MSEIDAVKREIDTYKMFLKIREQQAKKDKYKNYSQDGLIDEILEKEEEIHKKEAMYDSLAVDYRLAQEEIERLNNIINESRRILGKYKHFSTPTEEQNSENEDIVDKAYLTLHENLRK